MIRHLFKYDWKMSEDYPKEKNGKKVFSCFSCGGGSTMGYKLAGYDVIGCNEIDPKMMEVYIKNHNPKYSYLEPIQEFKNRNDLPDELYDLDILDGSPPCSNFSMAGNREKDWGKEKKFREGQAKQILDTLFFDFIDLAEKLKPKIVVAENVKGLLMGNARQYAKRILDGFDKAGYYVHYQLLDASKMGVPQRRERIFFCAIRKDLYKGKFVGILQTHPYLDLNFNEPEIVFGKIADNTDLQEKTNTKVSKYWDKVNPGQQFSVAHERGSFFNDLKASPEKVLPTIMADYGHGAWHYSIKRFLNKNELIKAGSFPSDYDFQNLREKYLIGMSVPPVMTAQIAKRIYDQWLCKI